MNRHCHHSPLSVELLNDYSDFLKFKLKLVNRHHLEPEILADFQRNFSHLQTINFQGYISE